MGNRQLCFHSVSVSGLLLFPWLLSDQLSCYFLSPSFYFICSGRGLTALCLWGRYISVCTGVHRTWLFMWVLGSWTRSSCLRSKPFVRWAISQPSILDTSSTTRALWVQVSASAQSPKKNAPKVKIPCKCYGNEKGRRWVPHFALRNQNVIRWVISEEMTPTLSNGY